MISERQYIKDNLREFFEELLQAQDIADVPIVYGSEKGPRPKTPFLMLEFRSMVSPGMPDYGKVSIDDGKEIQLVTQFTKRGMTMYGFGERAVDVLETIKSQLNVDIWVDKLRSRKLVIPRTMETIESPQDIETERENGASFDFDLTYLRVIETDPGHIEDIRLSRDMTLD